MAVKVKLMSGNTVTIADGDGIIVKDDHLHVTRWDGAGHQSLAVYASKTWAQADVVTEQA